MITAHGGALNTGRNTKKYFELMANLNADAIEVDIRSKKGELFLGHTHIPFMKKNRIPFSYVLEFCKKYNKRVNCDVKEKGLVKPIQQMAEAMGIEHLIYFTGSVSQDEVKDLGKCELYVNDTFLLPKFIITSSNLPKIKEYLDSFNSPSLKGLNVNCLYVSKKVCLEAKALGLGVSIYTVDDEQALEELVNMDFDNVTTNKIDVALTKRK
jgi:glycerophosphoryl diester phosphodiesterase